jgi:hypothetical protein
MRKCLNYLLLAGLCVLIWGCPYESMVPLDEPYIPVDVKLFGKWKNIGDEQSYSVVSKSDANVYRIVHNSWTSEHRSYDVKSFRAHMSVLNGTAFVNIQPDAKTAGSYYICSFRANQTPDSVFIRPVNESLRKKCTNSADLRAWMIKKMKSKNFFEKEEVFVKVGDSD